ncbi:MAG: tetratricopeptide repeat protein, partial [Myxococcales bacterium]|nr:tetratricopeptide repeat protein [Myxococcales bacterium]
LVELARDRGWTRLASGAALLAGRTLLFDSRHEEAATALASAVAWGTPAQALEARVWASRVATQSGRFAEGVVLAEPLLDAIEDAEPEARLALRNAVATTLRWGGRADLAEALLVRNLEEADAAGSVRRAADARMALASLLLAREDVEGARRAWEGARNDYLRVGRWDAAADARENLAHLARREGRHEEAVQLCRLVARDRRRLGVEDPWTLRATLGEALLASGRRDPARVALEEALEAAPERFQPSLRLMLLQVVEPVEPDWETHVRGGQGAETTPELRALLERRRDELAARASAGASDLDALLASLT